MKPALILVPLLTVLSPALAVANTKGSLVDNDDKHRKLAKTQETIQGLVDEAMESGVAGLAFAIDYVYLYNAEQQLTVKIAVPGADSIQNLLIDTGSSTLALCDTDKTIASSTEQRALLLPEYGQCNQYSAIQQCTATGSGAAADPVSFLNATCAVNNSITSLAVTGDTCSGYPVGWAGSVYQGNVSVYGGITEKEVALLENVTYSIMDMQQFYGCTKPIQGIFGVAFGSLNSVDILSPTGRFNSSSSLVELLCDTDTNGELVGCYTGAGLINSTTLTPPLQLTLDRSAEEGIDTTAAFGIYVNYSATVGAPSDEIVPGLGIFYSGDMAKNNIHYNGGTPQIASNGTQAGISSASFGNKPTWWILVLQNIRVGGESISNYSYPDSFCLGNKLGNCIADSGNSYLYLPIPQEICDKGFGGGGQVQVLSIDLAGQDGGVVTLEFPFYFLEPLLDGGWFKCTGTDGAFALGMPTFEMYYLAYDMDDATVTFVDLPQDPILWESIGYDSSGSSETNFGCYFPFMAATMIFGWMLILE